jgi:hypothetical protein
LCAVYGYPGYVQFRRLGHVDIATLDLTQESFARVLEKPVVAAANRTHGRFRAFLRADCIFFPHDCHDQEGAENRGGARPLLSIDARGAGGQRPDRANRRDG